MTAHHHSFRQGLLNEICQRWPKIPFTGGINKAGRYCIFVYDAFEHGTNLPAMGRKEVAAIEVEGSSEKDIEVLMTKLIMVCG